MLPQGVLVLVDLATVVLWALINLLMVKVVFCIDLLATVFHVLLQKRFPLERTTTLGVWAVESQLNFNHRLKLHLLLIISIT